MILNLAAHLLFNALVIRGLWRAMSYSEDEETGVPLKESRMILTGVRVWMQRTLGYFWSKPLVSCPACMASFHGTWYYWLVYNPGFSLAAVAVWLLWIPAVSTVTEYIHERI
jgi:hypothetical protein